MSKHTLISTPSYSGAKRIAKLVSLKFSDMIWFIDCNIVTFVYRDTEIITGKRIGEDVHRVDFDVVIAVMDDLILNDSEAFNVSDVMQSIDGVNI